jgi:hypothetical protein
MAILQRQNDKKHLRKDVFLSEKGGVHQGLARIIVAREQDFQLKTFH